MALVKYGGGVVEFKGAIGGIVFGKGLSGFTAKSNTMPTFNSSQSASTQKNIFGYLSNLWNSSLSDSQRSAWNNFGQNSPLTNSWGNSYNPSGLNSFIRHNYGNLIAGKSILNTTPTNYGWDSSGFVTVGLTWGNSLNNTITFPSMPLSGIITTEAINVYVSRDYPTFSSQKGNFFNYLTTLNYGDTFPLITNYPFTMRNGYTFDFSYRKVTNNYGYGNPRRGWSTS